MNTEERVYRKAVSLYLTDRHPLSAIPFNMLAEPQQSLWIMRAKEAIRQEEGQSDEQRDAATLEENMSVSAALADALAQGQSLLTGTEKQYMTDVIVGCRGLVPNLFMRAEINADKLLLMYYGEVSAVDAIQIIHKYYVNLQERYQAFKVKFGHKGEPPHGQ